MKRFIIRSTFLVSALSLCLGISLQARADGGCEGFPKTHKIVSDPKPDTLMDISIAVYGTPKYFHKIADENGITDSKLWLYVGDPDLVLPCITGTTVAREATVTHARTTKQFVFPAATPRVESSVENLPEGSDVSAIQIETVPVSALDALVSLISLPETVQQETTTVAESQKPETKKAEKVFVATAEQKSVVQSSASVPLHASSFVSTTPKTAKNPSVKPATYRLSIQATNLAPGVYPAVFAENQLREGLWKSRFETVAVVRPASNDGKSFFLDVTLKEPPTANSAVGVDFGEGNILYSDGGAFISQGLVTTDLLKVRLPKMKRPYFMLVHQFAKPSPRGGSVLRIAMTVGVPAGMGFMVGGPIGGLVGGGIPIVRNLINAKIQKIVAPQENQPPHVQYLLAGQADDISSLNGKFEKQQKEIDALKANRKEMTQ